MDARQLLNRFSPHGFLQRRERQKDPKPKSHTGAGDLFDALILQDVAAVGQALERGVDANARLNGKPALIWALDAFADKALSLPTERAQKMQVIEALLNAGANPNGESQTGPGRGENLVREELHLMHVHAHLSNPAHAAVALDDEAAARLLLRHGADPECVNPIVPRKDTRMPERGGSLESIHESIHDSVVSRRGSEPIVVPEAEPAVLREGNLVHQARSYAMLDALMELGASPIALDSLGQTPYEAQSALPKPQFALKALLHQRAGALRAVMRERVAQDSAESAQKVPEKTASQTIQVEETASVLIAPSPTVSAPAVSAPAVSRASRPRSLGF